jgi:hypothetical protein
MKQLATQYTFDPTAKTVTLTGLDVPLGYILLIINATRNQILYNLAQSALGAANYVQGANSVITLKADTAGMAETDSLTIFYDNGIESQLVLVQGPAGEQGPQGEPGVSPDVSGFVQSNPSGVAGASAVTNIVSLSQADYNAIATPSPTTLYIIK